MSAIVKRAATVLIGALYSALMVLHSPNGIGGAFGEVEAARVACKVVARIFFSGTSSESRCSAKLKIRVLLKVKPTLLIKFIDRVSTVPRKAQLANWHRGCQTTRLTWIS